MSKEEISSLNVYERHLNVIHPFKMDKGEARDQRPTNQRGPVELFVDRVTICGLLEAYNASLKSDRILFRIALIGAFVMIIYASVQIVRQYHGRNTILITSESRHQAPFPLLTVCFPPTGDRRIISNGRASLSKGVTAMMDKHNITVHDMIDYMHRIASLEFKGEDMNTPIHLVVRKAYTSLSAVINDSTAYDGDTVLVSAQSTCETTLSNCAFGSKQFNCCEVATFVTLWTSACFEIRLDDTITGAYNTTDPLVLQDIGLTFDVHFDWTAGIFQHGSASDGFHIFIDKLANIFSVPVPVPADSDVLITLSQPKHLQEITRCHVNGKTPRLKYFTDYDPHGVHCTFDSYLDILATRMGCLLPAMSYMPPNGTCSFDQVIVMILMITDAADEIIVSQFNSFEATRREIYHSMTSLASDKSCLPLCSRWTYPVLSASYGSMQYHNESEHDAQFENRSWSRIRVIAPYTVSWNETEKPVSAAYMATCDIGGVMGVYAGFSSITIVQVLIYGGVVIWSICRKRKATLSVSCAVHTFPRK